MEKEGEVYPVTAPSRPSGLFFLHVKWVEQLGLHSRTSQAGFAQGQPIFSVLSGNLATQRAASCRLDKLLSLYDLCTQPPTLSKCPTSMGIGSPLLKEGFSYTPC